MHKRLLLSLPVAEGDFTHVDVEVYYNKGGMNYYTGNLEKRGYYLSVQPLNKSNGIHFIAFTGVKQLVREAGRFSPKALSEFVVDYEMMNSMVEHILQKNNIKLSMPSKEHFYNHQLYSNMMQTDANSHIEQINISTQCG